MEEKPVVFDSERGTQDTSIAPGDKKPRIESTHLFQGEREVVIVHQTKEYSLRITRNGKLILTK
jgi:hemin uptake protein HemP